MTRQQINNLVKFAACMRAHGYPDYPDPVVQNGSVEEQPLPSSIDTSSAQFQAAQQTCSKLVASRCHPARESVKDGEMNQNTDAREQAERRAGRATVPAQAAGGQAEAGGGPARHDGGPAADRQTDRDRRGRRGWVVAGVVVVVAAAAVGAALASGAFRGSGNQRPGPAAGTRPGRPR